MATTKEKLLLQRPSHHHPLELLDLSNETGTLRCCLCYRKISVEAYTCQEGCETYYYSYHRACVEAPPQIDRQPLHPVHPLSLSDCLFLLHKRCTEIESTITHPHHPDHPLTLCERGDDDDDDDFPLCEACGRTVIGLKFSCKRCLVDLHVKCIARFPTHKHYLHEHKLLRFEEYRHLECNRCGKSTDSPLFRCVPCNFNLHEECMELPQVVESKIHWHPLTLHETFLEDDSGEYYCEHCEKTRDPQLGVYVCGHCKMISHPRIYHIECALPEIGMVYEKSFPPAAVEKLNEQIADKKEEILTMREKIEKATRELDELVMQRSIILKGEREDES